MRTALILTLFVLTRCSSSGIKETIRFKNIDVYKEQIKSLQKSTFKCISSYTPLSKKDQMILKELKSYDQQYKELLYLKQVKTKKALRLLEKLNVLYKKNNQRAKAHKTDFKIRMRQFIKPTVSLNNVKPQDYEILILQRLYEEWKAFNLQFGATVCFIGPDPNLTYTVKSTNKDSQKVDLFISSNERKLSLYFNKPHPFNISDIGTFYIGQYSLPKGTVLSGMLIYDNLDHVALYSDTFALRRMEIR